MWDLHYNNRYSTCRIFHVIFTRIGEAENLNVLLIDDQHPLLVCKFLAKQVESFLLQV